MIDTVNKHNPVPGLGRIEASNPCFHPDTILETQHGPMKISEIKEATMVYSMDGNGKLVMRRASAAFCSKKDAELVRVCLNNGSSLVVTPDHKVKAGLFRRWMKKDDIVGGASWIPAGELTSDHYVIGLCRTRRGHAYAGVRLFSQDNDEEVMEHRFVYESVHGNIPRGYDIHHVDDDSYHNDIDNLKMLAHSEHSRHSIMSRPNNHQVLGPNGKFVASGKHGKKDIRGIPDHLATRWPNFPRVVEVIKLSEKSDVYDIQVDDTHCVIANGIVAHNCGEQFLHDGDVCNLGSINLEHFVSDGGVLCFEKLELVTRTAVRMLDNVIDISDFPVEKVQKTARNNRRLGLGVMGY